MYLVAFFVSYFLVVVKDAAVAVTPTTAGQGDTSHPSPRVTNQGTAASVHASPLPSEAERPAYVGSLGVAGYDSTTDVVLHASGTEAEGACIVTGPVPLPSEAARPAYVRSLGVSGNDSTTDVVLHASGTEAEGACIVTEPDPSRATSPTSPVLQEAMTSPTDAVPSADESAATLVSDSPAGGDVSTQLTEPDLCCLCIEPMLPSGQVITRLPCRSGSSSAIHRLHERCLEDLIR
ncbi:unnamed protein product, partial [Laminaria digitata]